MAEVGVAFGQPNPSPRRAILWTSAQQYFSLLRPFGVFPWAFIDGSFTTEKEEPGDIDVVLATEVQASLAIGHLQNGNAMRLLNVPEVHEHFGVHVYTAFLPDDTYYVDLFQTFKPEEALARGLPKSATRGILKVAL